MNSKKILIFVVFIVGALSVVRFFTQGPSRVDPGTKEALTESVTPSTETAGDQKNQASAAVMEDPTFREWIRAEAKKLNSTNLDGEKEEQRLSEFLAHIDRQKSRLLLQVAQSGSSAGERILSTYLLVKGGPRTRSELQQLITSPLPDRGPVEPHTLEETLGIREKSLRIMAVDGLVSQAAKDPNARNVLAKAVEDIQDPYIKDYARRRLAELNH